MGKYFNQNGYDVRITVGTLTLDTTLAAKDNGLCGDLVINYVCNTSATAEFSFIPPESLVFLETMQGKQVLIWIRTGSQWEQVFYGFVDTPVLNFIERKITLKCTDSRQNRVIQLPKSVVQGVGSYSEVVFGVAKDQSEELEKRLNTVAGDFDFDRFGNYYLTPWAPKTVADYTFGPPDISYQQNPDVQYTNREKAINTINIKIVYTYQRLHQQLCTFVWAGFTDFLRDWWNPGQPSFPAKDNIQAAAANTDWKIASVTGINCTNLWPAQGFANGIGTINWQPNDITQETKGRTKFAGYLKTNTIPPAFVTIGDPPKLVPQYTPVLDSKGNQIMDIVKTTVRDTSSHLCRGAAWSSCLKFTQTINEEWNIQLKSSQAIAQNGVVDSFESYSLTDPYDTSKWEKSDTIAQVTFNFYSDYKTKASEQLKALQVGLNQARHNILDLYRDVTVSWRFKSLQPKLDLRNTLSVDINQGAIGSSAYIKTKGRVYSISHYINFKTTEAYTNCSLKISRSSGSANNDAWQIPTVAQDPSYIGVPKQIGLGTHIGIDPATNSGSDKWTGWIANTNKKNSSGTTYRTNFAETFVVDFPAISPALRDDLTYNADAVYNLAIPNDYLEISF